MLVGSDKQLSPELKQKIKNEWSWTSGNGSVVDGSHKYSGFFSQIKMKNGNQPAASNFNRNKIPQINHRNEEGKVLLRHLCSWIGSVLRRKIREQCSRGDIENNEVERLTLTGFLASNFAKEYFQDGTWKQYKKGGNYLALLALLNFWSSDLMQVNFNLSEGIFNHNEEGFKLTPFMNGKGKILYLQQSSAGGENNLSKITYHSGGMWTIQLCPNSSSCSSDNGLNLTLGNGKFCVIDKVCFSDSDNKDSIQGGKDGWKQLINGAGLWTNVFGNKNGVKPSQAALISLVAASFSDVKGVSLSINADPEKGKMLLKKLN